MVTFREQAMALVGSWARPPDLPAKIALALAGLLALAAVLGRGRTLLFGFEPHDPAERASERRRFLGIVGMAAGLLSIGYIATYLQGGPRIIDATTYFLQGRALSHGDLSWTPLDPSGSFRGRFLLYREGVDAASLGGIFPPGYPLVLALGFMLGAPMIVGPVLAIALVFATYHLARALAEETAPRLAEPIARAAALLSVFCAALRYHTADTMSHGASALGVTVALLCAVRARAARASDAGAPRTETRSPLDNGRLEALFAGAAVGFVVATRPPSALPIALVVVWLLWPTRPVDGRRSRLLVLLAAGAVPGLFLLLLSQRAVAGAWLGSTQKMYYALSDGPPGCFRWGFGKGTGCLFEHGDFVEARLKDGYGAGAAAMTTLRRIHKHVLDVANLEPLALLVLVPLLRRGRHATRSTALVAATALVGLQILVYAPFYFDGDYPGGGARFFADVLPIEHALIVLGVASLLPAAAASRSSHPRPSEIAFTRAAMALFGLAVFGFAVHASHEHGALRDRDGGAPMFEPDVLARASVSKGLVFVETDHGFSLGHDPAARPNEHVVVARFRNDDSDRMLYEALGRPPSYLYRIAPAVPPATRSTTSLLPWAPPESGATLRFETETEWPPLSQENGFAAPAWSPDCASAKRALVVVPEPGRRAKVVITIPVPSAGRWSVELHTSDGTRLPHAPSGAGASKEATVSLGDATWTWKPQNTCTVLPAKEVELHPPHEHVTIETTGSSAALDWISLRKAR